jgi:2-amino-4-hydroxy-6-hydroxymethyldihydropteridine diphosphokinase
MHRSDDVSLAIALGANLPHADAGPRQTLLAVRPLLSDVVHDWAGVPLQLSWSPLFDTTPVGGPPDQPRYWNAVVVVNGLIETPSSEAALTLLRGLNRLESQFGRRRSLEQLWGPRTLDLDLLFWGEHRMEHSRLVLPHPRLHLRNFVLEPLLAAMNRSAEWID